MAMNRASLACLALCGCFGGTAPPVPLDAGAAPSKASSNGAAGTNEAALDDAGHDAGHEPPPPSETPSDSGALPGNDAGHDGGHDAGQDAGSVTLYLDTDHDGYGDPSMPATTGVSNAQDCYDGNAAAHPGASAWQATDRGDGSYDFDCDSIETMEHTTRIGACTIIDPDCIPPTATDPPGCPDWRARMVLGTVGWARECEDLGMTGALTQCFAYADFELPACGTIAPWKWNAAACPGDVLQLQQRCR